MRAGNDTLSSEVQAVFQRCAPAVVKIEAEDDSGPLSGTGFFIDPNGTIYTNYSVGGESHDIVISYGAERYPAYRIAADARSGLAILTIRQPAIHGGATLPADPANGLSELKVEPQKTPFLPLGKASDLGTASLVMTIGYPLDLPVTPNVGCVGGFGIYYGDNQYFAVSHIRANVPAQYGEAGAPLLNMDGEVVGILESSVAGGAGCFVLPIEAAEKVHSDVVRFGEVRPGWLGIRFDKSDAANSAIEVQGFVDGSPAETSGVKPGDIIQQVGDRKVSTLEDVLNAAFYMTAGEAVPLTISRDGQTMVVPVVPGMNPLVEQPVAPGPVIGFSLRINGGGK